MIYYQDEHLYYFRKPAGIPSTFWKESSFLDLMLSSLSGESLSRIYCGMPVGRRGCQQIVQSLLAFFGKELELWLLNRLDNETSGLLYFAKNPRVYQQFKRMQSDFLLNKYYVAEVYGDISPLLKGGKGGSNTSKGGNHQITYPLAHHKFNPDRMVVIKQPSDIKKAKWTLHHLTTEIVEFEFLPASRTSILLIRIQKGIRHQIRAHLASIGHPICGDQLYSKSDHKEYATLQLFSVGLESVE